MSQCFATSHIPETELPYSATQVRVAAAAIAHHFCPGPQWPKGVEKKGSTTSRRNDARPISGRSD